METQPSRLWWLINPITITLMGATTMAFYVTGSIFTGGNGWEGW